MVRFHMRWVQVSLCQEHMAPTCCIGQLPVVVPVVHLEAVFVYCLVHWHPQVVANHLMVM